MALNPTENAHKRLTRIRLVNWHLFADTTISCQGTTYFIGVNGAGKSTILDAIQFALVGGQRDVRFNQAALAGGKRSLASYVRGELGTEGQRYLRGDATGVVALEYANPDGTRFVHGAVVDAFEDGRSPEVVYFIVHQAALDDDWFWQPGQGGRRPYDTRAFKRHLEHFGWPRAARAQVFTRVEDYRLHLLNRLGQLRESFLAKIVKGLAFTPLTDIRGFVHNYLLDENLVDVKNLQAQLETLRHFEGLAADVRARIAALTHIDELDQERTAQRRRRVTNGYVRRRAQADAHLTALKARRLELDELRLALNRSALQREALAEALRHAQAALVDAQVALQTDAQAARERELRGQMAALEAELQTLRAQEAQALAALACEVESATRLSQLLAADGQPAPPGLAAFLGAAAAGDQSPLAGGALPAAIGALQAELEAWGQAYAGQAALVEEQARLLRAEEAEVRQALAQLRAGNREASFEAEAPAAMRLRRLLQSELGLAAHDVLFLCAALEVADEVVAGCGRGGAGRRALQPAGAAGALRGRAAPVPRAPPGRAAAGRGRAGCGAAHPPRGGAERRGRDPGCRGAQPASRGAGLPGPGAGRVRQMQIGRGAAGRAHGRDARMFRAPRLQHAPPGSAGLPPLVHWRARPAAPDRAVPGPAGGAGARAGAAGRAGRGPGPAPGGDPRPRAPAAGTGAPAAAAGAPARGRATSCGRCARAGPAGPAIGGGAAG